jgi:hypothetical protein
MVSAEGTSSGGGRDLSKSTASLFDEEDLDEFNDEVRELGDVFLNGGDLPEAMR